MRRRPLRRARCFESHATFLAHAHVDHAAATAELKRRLSVPVEGPHEGDRFWIDLLKQSAQQRWTVRVTRLELPMQQKCDDEKRSHLEPSVISNRDHSDKRQLRQHVLIRQLCQDDIYRSRNRGRGRNMGFVRGHISQELGGVSFRRHAPIRCNDLALPHIAPNRFLQRFLKRK